MDDKPRPGGGAEDGEHRLKNAFDGVSHFHRADEGGAVRTASSRKRYQTRYELPLNQIGFGCTSGLAGKAYRISLSRLLLLVRLVIDVSLAGYTLPNANAAMHGPAFPKIRAERQIDPVKLPPPFSTYAAYLY